MKNHKLMSVLSLSLLTIGLTGCGSTAPSIESVYQDPKHEPFGRYEEPVTIKGVMEYLPHNDSRVPQSVTPDNQKFVQILKEDLNLNFEYLWKVPPQQYENKLASSILSKQRPDILKVSATQYKDFKEKGMLRDLTDTYEYASPAVKSFLERDPSIIETLKDEDGKIYAIPQYDDVLKQVPVMYYRKDWLKELNLEVPTTPDELFHVLQEFKTKKGATDGISCCKDLTGSYFSLERFLQMFGYQPFSWMDDGMGGLVSSDISDDAKAGIAYLNRLYQNGLMAKDYAATDATSCDAQIKNAKSGVTIGPWWLYEYPLCNVLNDQDWGAAKIPTYNGAKITVDRQNISYYYVVLNQCTHPEALMKMINMYVDLDGKDRAKPEDGYVWSWCPTQFNDPNDIDETYLKFNDYLKEHPDGTGDCPEDWTGHEKMLWKSYSNYLEWKDDHGAVKYESNTFANIIGRIDQDSAWSSIRDSKTDIGLKYDEYYGPVTKGQSKFGGQLATHTSVFISKVIAGEKNLDSDWNSYIAEWNKLGGEQITTEINEWYSANKKA